MYFFLKNTTNQKRKCKFFVVYLIYVVFICYCLGGYQNVMYENAVSKCVIDLGNHFMSSV